MVLVFLKFFASLLSGYRNFIEVSAAHVFNTQAFLTMRSRSIGQPPEPMLTHFLDSHGSMDYLERGLGSDENTNNLLDKLQDAIRRGQNPISILTTNIGSPYNDSLKVLEADIQHANNLAVSIPRRKSDTVLQMKLVYDHLAPIILFLLQWIDCSSSCLLSSYVNIFHIIVYMVGFCLPVHLFLEQISSLMFVPS